MVIAGWRKNFEILADAGKRSCANCHHATRHFLVGERKEVRLYFIPVARFGRKRHLICEVCGYTSPVTEQEAGRILTTMLEAVPAAAPVGSGGLEWLDVGPSGGEKAMNILCARYTWPWTVEDLDAGLRGELSDTFFRCLLEAATAATGEPDDTKRVGLRRTAEAIAQAMRVGAALTSARARTQGEGLDERQGIDAMVSGVCAEMGVGREEGQKLAEQTLAAFRKAPWAIPE